MNVSKPRPPGLLVLITALAIIGPAGMDLYLPAVSSMPAALAASVDEVQLTLSVFMLALGAGQLLLGPIADRRGRRPVLQLSLLLFCLGSLGAALSPDVDWLIGWRAVQGMGACGAGLVAFAMVRDLYGSLERGRVYSLINAGIGIAPALAPIFGGYLLLWGSWRLCFWTLLLSGALLLIACMPLSESRPEPPAGDVPPFWQAYRRLLAHSSYLSYAGAGLACMGGLFTYFSLSPLLLIVQLQVSEQAFAFYFASNALVMVLTSLWAARILQYRGLKATVLLGLGCVLVGGLVMGALALCLPPSPMTLVLPMWLASAGFALCMGASAAGALAEFGDMAASATALMSLLRLGGAALVGTLAVWVDATSVWPLVAVLIGCALLSLLTVWRYCVDEEAE